MASGLYPDINFPSVNLGGLEQLPAINEQAKQRQGRQNLADMASEFDLTTEKGLASASKKALSQGLFDEANQFLTAAQRLKGLNIQAARDTQYSQFIAPIMAGILGKGGAASAAPDEGGAPSFGRPSTGAPPSQADVWSGPQGKIPQQPQPQAAPPPSLNAPPPNDIRTELPSPSEEILAKAEGSPPPVSMAGTQLAGPPPTPGTTPEPPAAPPQAPPQVPQVPAWLAGAAQAPVGTPPAASEPAKSQRISGTIDSAVEGRIRQLATTMVQLGPLASQSQRETLSQLLRTEVNKTSWSPEMKAYQIDQSDKFAVGEPLQTIADWRKDQKLDITRAEGANKLYESVYIPKGEQAKTVSETVDHLASIMTNPRFATSGPLDTGMIDDAQKELASVAGTLRAMGVPPIFSEDTITKLTTPAALKEAFSALTNQSVIASLNGLGAGKSDKDVLVVRSTMPSLMNTPEGNRLIVEFMQKVADRKALESKIAGDYLESRGNKATAPGMTRTVNEAVAKFRDEGILMDKDGKLTDLGQRMKDATTKYEEGNTWTNLINKTLRGIQGMGEASPEVGSATALPSYLPESADYYRPPVNRMPRGLGEL